VSIILVPNGGHRLDAGFYKKRYPQARVVTPAASRAKVEDVIAVDAVAEDELPKHGVTIHALPGWKQGELGYEFALPAGGRALVLCDVLTNENPVPGFGGWVTSNLTTAVKGPLGVARMMKLALLKDRAAAREGLARLADIPDLRLVATAHGLPVIADCAGALRAGAASL
jgi:hypothetical protein